MPVALQVLISGLAAGSVISLVALGLSLVLGLTRTLPFAHGDLVVASPALAVLVVLGSTPIARSPAATDSLMLILLSLGLAVIMSLASYAVGVRPLLDGRSVVADPLRAVAAALGLALLLRAALGQAFPHDTTAVPDALHLSTRVLRLGDGVTVPVRDVEVLAAALVIAAVTQVLVRRAGRRLRAVSDAPQLAALSGIDGRRVMAAGFAVAGLLAGIAGLLGLPGGSGISADSGVSMGLAAAAAVWLAGAGRLGGAVVAALALGVAEAALAQLPDPGVRLTPLVPAVVVVLAVSGRSLRPRAPA